MSNLRKVELDESITLSGEKKLVVVDFGTHEILKEMLLQMKMMNMHLSIVTDEELKETDLREL